ncbi:hypothetical protein DM298_08790 [Lactobacillus amylovorus]|uniref:Uncharacterized protein n=2 Tax=Lactobacillus amylovorus TaxID=1604 RepID=F0TGL9_LACAM|nr:hypothetical protein LA2_00345 [Lactobacillus amylovorus GRL 1112]ADZ07863.1 hypothetical protein LAC30SC_08820 [Lactobacillus amylovorus]AEA31048.1 hypothetical protein LAB52_00280 [Lactobacillus amylovorus GRL1118]ADQ58465.1 hypothetical protein LA2_02395 [Lactobacillus amylovorus GRL 1112]ADQ59737.1 hypothetical protein LA2_09150 [Lactobacillus amylovorus GRL 1112]
MESRNTKRSIQSKRKHTEKLCLVLRVVPQRVSTLKTEYNPSKKPRQSKRTDCRATEKRILE